MKTGALYIRVSTGKQEELSPDAQRRLLLEYAEKNNIIISSEYIFEEDGISGRKADKRPQFQKMIGLAKSADHPFDVILVWKYSRFARNQEESIVYKSLLKKKNVDVVSISEPLVDGPFGSLIERIIEWMDEYYSIRLSGEVTRGMIENAMRGKFQSRPPLGYRLPHAKGTPVIVPEEADTVRLIFDLYANKNMAVYDITRYLNDHGYQTSHKKPFETRGVNYILDNVFYTGKTIWNKHDSKKNARDESEWIIADGEHEAIISPELYEKAKQRRESGYHPRCSKPSGICKHWLSGMLKCSACGRTLSLSSHKDSRYGRTYINFQCYGYLKGKCNVSHQISEKRIAPIVLNELKKAIASENIQFRVLDDNPECSAVLQNLQNRIGDIEKKEERIRLAYMDGIDSLEEYKKNKNILQNEKNQLEKQYHILSMHESKPDVKTLIQKIKTVYEGLQNDSLSMQARNELLKSVVEKIVYNKAEQTVDVYFYTSTNI